MSRLLAENALKLNQCPDTCKAQQSGTCTSMGGEESLSSKPVLQHQRASWIHTIAQHTPTGKEARLTKYQSSLHLGLESRSMEAYESAMTFEVMVTKVNLLLERALFPTVRKRSPELENCGRTVGLLHLLDTLL